MSGLLWRRLSICFITCIPRRLLFFLPDSLVSSQHLWTWSQNASYWNAWIQPFYSQLLRLLLLPHYSISVSINNYIYLTFYKGRSFHIFEALLNLGSQRSRYLTAYWHSLSLTFDNNEMIFSFQNSLFHTEFFQPFSWLWLWACLKPLKRKKFL